MNNCIQALRNTTFMIQGDKSRMADFEAWYTAWQSKMKLDPVMRWLNDSRVTVVHRGELESKSTGRIRLITGYDDVARETVEGLPAPDAETTDGDADSIELTFRPVASFEEAMQTLNEAMIPEAVLRNAYVVIERRWVAESLPGSELLQALAHCHEFLLAMVADAHVQVGSSHDVDVDHGDEVTSTPLPFGRLPCMVTSRESRTLRFAIRDGRLDLGGRIWSLDRLDLSPEKLESAARRYKARPVKLDKFPMTPVDWLPSYIAQGRAILMSGEEHGWFVFFFRGRKVVDMRRVAARDAIDKRLLSQQIAEHVAVNDIDGLLEVSEAWAAPLSMDDDGVPIAAAEHEERRELLSFYAVDALGHEAGVEIPIERRRFRRRPTLGAPQYSKVENMFYLPTREVWRLKAERDLQRGAVKSPAEDGAG